ncbi:MAG: TrmB family transcriptional regulator [Candidatus Bathyarchaeia archaeon]
MIIKDQDAQILKQLGLSACQAKVYLALLFLGKTQGKNLWRCSGVARQDIYRILQELQEKGFVEKRLDVTPAEFEAVSIEDVVSILLMHKLKEYQQVKKNTIDLIKKVQKKQGTQFPEEAQFRFIVQKAQAQRRKKCIQAAKEHLDVVTTWERFVQVMSEQMGSLKGSLRRGVAHRWVVTNPANKSEIPKTAQRYLRNPHCKIRFLAHFSPEVAFSLYDGKEMLIATNAGKPIYADAEVLWSNNASLAAIVQRYFDSLWAEALENNLVLGASVFPELGKTKRNPFFNSPAPAQRSIPFGKVYRLHFVCR